VGCRVCEPLVPSCDPLQLPEAVQTNASVEDHVIVVELPTVRELAANFTLGAGGGGGTVTAKLALPAADEPMTLAQVSEYVAVPPAVGNTAWLPLAGSEPLQFPDAVQPVAFADDQVIMDDWPRSMALLLSTNVGAAGTTSVKLTELEAEVPDVFVQDSVYVLVPTFDIVTVWLPLAARAPVQSAVPEAVQLLASMEFHVSVAVPPTATAVALRVIVGTTAAVSACMNP
jgi:hypothetical protein